jgi:hypothetical protein
LSQRNLAARILGIPNYPFRWPGKQLGAIKPTGNNMLNKEQLSNQATPVYAEPTCAQDDDAFMEMLARPFAGAEQAHFIEEGCANKAVWRREIEDRSGRCEPADPYRVFSARFNTLLAATRYFTLMNSARKSMNEMFTQSEVQALLNSVISPMSALRACKNLATMFADDRGIENLDEMPLDSPTRILMTKLLSLTFLQDTALLELTNLFWRRKGMSIDDFGLELCEEPDSQC